MRGKAKCLAVCIMIVFLFWSAELMTDRKTLNEELIRLHIVANSDSCQDQNIKLQIRDAVVKSLYKDLSQMSDMDAAREYLQNNLQKIQESANRVLKSGGFDSQTAVSLCRETFDTRYYDTFTLPAGVYESLRIVIGEGKGRNWWCVAFPSLCIPETGETFEDAAVSAGFSDSLSHTLSRKNGYEVRFFFLDQLGRLENIFFDG